MSLPAVDLVALHTALTGPSFLGRLRAGASCAGRGTALVLRHGELLRLALVPVALSVLLYAGFAWAAWSLLGPAHAALFPWTAPEAWYGVLVSLASGLVWLLLGVALFLAALVLTVMAASVLAAPFLDTVSARAESLLTGVPAPPGPGFLESLWRALRVQVVMLLLYAAGLAVAAGVCAIPVLGVLVGPLVQGGWTLGFLALQFMDWPAERRRQGVRARVSLVRQHGAAALGFGAGCWLLLFLPFTPPFLAVGGTLLFLGLTPPPRP